MFHSLAFSNGDLLVDLAYNLVVAAVCVGGLAVMRRRRTVTVCAGVSVAAGLASACVAVGMVAVLRLSPFDLLRLASYGIFLYLPSMLLAVAWLLRRVRRAAAVAAAVAGLLVGGVGIDAFLIEPEWLEVHRVTVRSPKVSRPVRVVLVADLQTDHVGGYERQALELAWQQQPDMLLFAGDYLQADASQRPRLRRELQRLMQTMGPQPELGSYAVRGNTDGPLWTRIFEGTGTKAFRQTERVTRGELTVTALSPGHSFSTKTAVDETDGFHIVVGHSPNFALGDIRADLLLAGHTHGGQVRLPFFGPLVTLSNVPRSWASGATELPGDRTLVVSRGVGRERRGAPQVRFLCRPQIVVVDIRPQR